MKMSILRPALINLIDCGHFFILGPGQSGITPQMASHFLDAIVGYQSVSSSFFLFNVFILAAISFHSFRP
jgi:hypothetical protein